MAIGLFVAVFLCYFIARAFSQYFITYIPRDYERTVGTHLVSAFVTDESLESKEITQYLSRLGDTILEQSKTDIGEISFGVLCSKTENALAFPGGFIFVTSGLVGLLEHEAELYSILGHEVGHIANRDSLVGLSTELFGYITTHFLLVSLIGFNPGVADMTSELTQLSYSREQELSADSFGMHAVYGKYQSLGSMISAFEKLRSFQGSTGQLAALFTTHPDTGERIERMKEIAQRREWRTDLRFQRRSAGFAAFKSVVERNCSDHPDQLKN